MVGNMTEEENMLSSGQLWKLLLNLFLQNKFIRPRRASGGAFQTKLSIF